MENELEKLSKQELIRQFLMLKKFNEKLESSIQIKDEDIAKKDFIIANLNRMLFGSKKERFIAIDKAQLLLTFEEFATDELLNDATPVKQKITYERQKPSAHAGRNKLPENLPVVEEIIEPLDLSADMVKMGEEITEILEYTPAQFFKRKIVLYPMF